MSDDHVDMLTVELRRQSRRSRCMICYGKIIVRLIREIIMEKDNNLRPQHYFMFLCCQYLFFLQEKQIYLVTVSLKMTRDGHSLYRKFQNS